MILKRATRLSALLRLGAAIALLAAGSASATTQGCASGGPWTQSWNSAIDHGMPVGGSTGWSNMTLRMEATTSAGGSQLRVDLSNEFASNSVTFAHVSVAQQLNGAQTLGPPVGVTFGGSTSVTLSAGAEVQSDPVAFPTTRGERLLISVFLPVSTVVQTANAHTYASQTEFNIVNQDATMEQSPPVNNTFGFTSYLNGLDVDATSAQTIVAVGDSITDTGGTPVDTDTRWPDYLARRTNLSVINQGISGNWVTNGSGTGPSLTARWQHDVLNVPGVRTVIDAGGINDLRNGVSASTLEQAQASLVTSAHAAGLRMLLSTITPCSGASLCTSAFEVQRQAYNTWVRSGSSGADGVADFDSAVAAGAALASMYDDGGHIHPSSAGEAAMGNVIDSTKL